jgi:hypothetical protein
MNSAIFSPLFKTRTSVEYQLSLNFGRPVKLVVFVRVVCDTLRGSRLYHHVLHYISYFQIQPVVHILFEESLVHPFDWQRQQFIMYFVSSTDVGDSKHLPDPFDDERTSITRGSSTVIASCAPVRLLPLACSIS